MLLAGILLALQDAAPAVETARARGWDDFPVFVWREKYAGKPLPEELAEPFGGVILMREEDSSWARERKLSYLVWNVAGRDALHLDADEAWNARVEQWIQTQDEKLLVREPCLNDPQTVAQLYATLDATIAMHGDHPGLGFVLGDEVGLTPNGDPFDLCRCELCATKWQEYGQKNDLPERAPLTDEVRLGMLADDFSQLGAWLARRRFERARMTELLEILAQRIHTHESLRVQPVGLLGIGELGPFGSVDLASGLPFLDFVECYPVSDTRELLFALPERRVASARAPSRPRAALATVFVGDETADGAAWQVWEHWLRGGNGVVLWSDQALAASPAHRTRLAQAVERIRQIELSFPRIQAPVSRIGLVHDADSIAVSWLKDALLDGATWPRRHAGYQQEHGTRERSARAWLRELEGTAALPISIPLSRLGEPCFGSCKTLVLANVLVLGPEDVLSLEHQLDLGTTLVVEGPLGWVDRNGQPWKEDVLKRLRERAPERIRTEVEHSEEDLFAWKPAFTGEAGRLPWLISSRGLEPFFDVGPGELLVTALPNLQRADRNRLKPLQLQVEPPPGYRLEWVQPANGRELPAGDAAVFLLRAEER